MPQMTATVDPLVRLGGAIHLTARRSDGCTIQVMLGRDGTRGHVARSVTSDDGRLVAAFVRSWPLSDREPKVAADVRDAIRIAEEGLAQASAR